jgi:hypothetical protein
MGGVAPASFALRSLNTRAGPGAQMVGQEAPETRPKDEVSEAPEGGEEAALDLEVELEPTGE